MTATPFVVNDPGRHRPSQRHRDRDADLSARHGGRGCSPAPCTSSTSAGAASWAPPQVYEEGLYIPITKIVDKGEINHWLVDIIAANVREPVQVIGDIYSEIASNEVGGKRLVAMMDEFGLEHRRPRPAHPRPFARRSKVAVRHLSELHDGRRHERQNRWKSRRADDRTERHRCRF